MDMLIQITLEVFISQYIIVDISELTERIVKLEEREVSASKEVQLYHKAVVDLVTYYHSCITLMNHQLAYLDSIVTQLENN